MEREALKLALVALEESQTNNDTMEFWDRKSKAITAIKEALAQPAQEPVARVSGTYGGRFVYDPINRATILPIGMALYAGPPQRPWVGLTPEDILALFDEHNLYGSKLVEFARAVETKIKEKNNG